MSFPYDLSKVPTPAFVCDRVALRRNLEILARVQQAAGCKILLALKGFAMWGTFDLVRQYLPGVTASSTHEARLGAELFSREVHACAPAYSHQDFEELLELCDHIVVNSPAQLTRFGPVRDVFERQHGRRVSLGLRINPEHREVEVELYDPCAPRSRLGTTQTMLSQTTDEELSAIDGVHLHTLCELGSDALERTVAVVRAKFDGLLRRVRWVNLGGGHHITRPGYDIERLVRIVTRLRDDYGVEVYLEPGEAVALNTGVLVAQVLDIMHNEIDIAILDTSATAHMPDVLEMPYRPRVWIHTPEGDDRFAGGQPGEHAHTYRLGGLSCLAGDIIGDYSFARPLQTGDRLVFDDMIHYTMVKTTTFNGVRLPSICVADPSRIGDPIRELRRFDYDDYKNRLG